MLATGSDIGKRQAEVRTQLTLNVKVPLQNLGLYQVVDHGGYAGSRTQDRNEGAKLPGKIRDPASTGSDHRGADHVGRTGGRVVHNVGEELVIEDAEPCAEDSLVMTEQPIPEVRRVSKAHPGSEIGVVGLLLNGVRKCRVCGAKSMVDRRKWLGVARGALVFVAQPVG